MSNVYIDTNESNTSLNMNNNNNNNEIIKDTNNNKNNKSKTIEYTIHNRDEIKYIKPTINEDSDNAKASKIIRKINPNDFKYTWNIWLRIKFNIFKNKFFQFYDMTFMICISMLLVNRFANKFYKKLILPKLKKIITK